ncbi:MAG: GNAT family N-acetyltransferase [Bacteroidota bacterium]
MTSEIKKQVNLLRQDLSIPGYSLEVYQSMANVPTAWEIAQPKDNIFLQRTYLSIMEKAPPKGMTLRYMLFYFKGKPIGLALCQIQYFKADQSLNMEEDQKTPCFFSTFARFIRGLVASRVEFYTLACGNLLLTGEHGFYFKSNKISLAQQFELVENGMIRLQKQMAKEGIMISAALIKDMYEDQRAHTTSLTEHSFNEFTIQPNMVMDLRPEWTCMDDYAAALYSKYRVRMRRARGKAKSLVLKELDLSMVEKSLSRLYELYNSIAENSGFNVVNLNERYLLELKRELPDRFKLFGYFDEGELVAFYTTIHNGHELEAHFLGFDRRYNRSNQIYLNILYDIINIGIERGVDRIIFARTAMAIKSSVGAIAKEMYCYMRHRNAFSNRFLHPILDYLKPNEDWEARHPFKPVE